MRLDRLFHVLVMGGAALGLSACDDGPGGGSTGDGGAGGGATTGAGATGGNGGNGAAGGDQSGGGSATGGAGTGGELTCSLDPGDACGCPCCWVTECTNTEPCCESFCAAGNAGMGCCGG